MKRKEVTSPKRKVETAESLSEEFYEWLNIMGVTDRISCSAKDLEYVFYEEPTKLLLKWLMENVDEENVLPYSKHRLFHQIISPNYKDTSAATTPTDSLSRCSSATSLSSLTSMSSVTSSLVPKVVVHYSQFDLDDVEDQLIEARRERKDLYNKIEGKRDEMQLLETVETGVADKKISFDNAMMSQEEYHQRLNEEMEKIDHYTSKLLNSLRLLVKENRVLTYGEDDEPSIYDDDDNEKRTDPNRRSIFMSILMDESKRKRIEDGSHILVAEMSLMKDFLKQDTQLTNKITKFRKHLQKMNSFFKKLLTQYYTSSHYLRTEREIIERNGNEEDEEEEMARELDELQRVYEAIGKATADLIIKKLKIVRLRKGIEVLDSQRNRLSEYLMLSAIEKRTKVLQKKIILADEKVKKTETRNNHHNNTTELITFGLLEKLKNVLDKKYQVYRKSVERHNRSDFMGEAREKYRRRELVRLKRLKTEYDNEKNLHKFLGKQRKRSLLALKLLNIEYDLLKKNYGVIKKIETKIRKDNFEENYDSILNSTKGKL